MCAGECGGRRPFLTPLAEDARPLWRSPLTRPAASLRSTGRSCQVTLPGSDSLCPRTHARVRRERTDR